MWGKIEDLWKEIRAFFDRVIGWIYYVLGDDEDPYVYDDFFDNTYPDEA